MGRDINKQPLVTVGSLRLFGQRRCVRHVPPLPPTTLRPLLVRHHLRLPLWLLPLRNVLLDAFGHLLSHCIAPPACLLVPTASSNVTDSVSFNSKLVSGWLPGAYASFLFHVVCSLFLSPIKGASHRIYPSCTTTLRCVLPLYLRKYKLFFSARHPYHPLCIEPSRSPARGSPLLGTLIIVRVILCTVPSEARTRPARYLIKLLWGRLHILAPLHALMRPSTPCFSINSAPHTRCLMHSLSVLPSRP